jgi:hypothetical protein
MYILEKYLRMKFQFSFGQSMKKITMVKVGYFSFYGTKDDVG